MNSLHGQGILEPGERVVVEGVAEDGTIEAIRIADAPGFALGVQWHAEYDPQSNPINRALFQAFGEAVAARKRAAAAGGVTAAALLRGNVQSKPGAMAGLSYRRIKNRRQAKPSATSRAKLISP